VPLPVPFCPIPVVDHGDVRGPRVDDGDRAAHETGEPAALVRRPAVLPQAVLREGEVPAERLWQVGVGRGQLDPGLRELWDRQATAAVLGRDAQRPVAGLLEPAHRLERQLTVELALEGAGGDTVQEMSQLPAHLVEVPAAERRPVEAGQAEGDAHRTPGVVNICISLRLLDFDRWAKNRPRASQGGRVG
jgi:hypothetical protein